MSKLTGALTALSLLLAAPAAFAEGDVANGEKVFRKCAACHAVDPAAGNKAGPNLHGVIGRTTGTLEGFRFSPAMTEAGAGGQVWTEELLSSFLADPKSMMKGHKMTFAGLKKEEERADVIAFLKSKSE